MTQVGQTLLDSQHERFTQALDEVSAPVLELIERDSDLAIFQVLRQDTSEFTQYGINHSVHADITGFLVAQRLGWSATDLQKVFKAALTMNIAMLELQGQLAAQVEPPNLAQSQQIFDHPRISAQMLELSGVTDRDWLDAVRQHHETPDGAGYPMGLSQVSDFAALVRRVDIYTAKLSARRGRDSIAADRAGRMMFMQDPGHPMIAALVKEFGIYPPGCFVRLVSGEIGVVVKRGPTVMTPMVAALTTAGGGHLLEPVRRDTSRREYAIAAAMGGREPKPALKPEKLMALACA